jgi:hypothetical protein
MLIAGAFALGSVAAPAADEDNPAYKMGMASQRQHDLQLQEAKARNNSPVTPEESKAIKEAAVKARAAYARMTPEEKAIYKNGMSEQRHLDLLTEKAQSWSEPGIHNWTVEDAHRQDNELSTAKPKPLPSR